MVRATLHSRTNCTQELSLLAALAAGREVLARATARAKQSRLRLARRASFARARAFSRGYQEGLSAAREELEQVALQARSLYREACMAASKDVRKAVVEICEELIRHEPPEILLPWVDRALAILASTRSATVRVSQRHFSSTSTHLKASHLGVQVVAAPPSQAAEFVVANDSGEISFAWRTALEQLLKEKIRE